jgi:hypothetical protein
MKEEKNFMLGRKSCHGGFERNLKKVVIEIFLLLIFSQRFMKCLRREFFNIAVLKFVNMKDRKVFISKFRKSWGKVLGKVEVLHDKFSRYWF